MNDKVVICITRWLCNLQYYSKHFNCTQIDTVIAGKWKTVDVAIKMKKEWPVNEDNFIAEAKVMK